MVAACVGRILVGLKMAVQDECIRAAHATRTLDNGPFDAAGKRIRIQPNGRGRPPGGRFRTM